MARKRDFARGSAMPETALTMSLVLLVFLGLIKLALVGYEQSEVDGAAFVAAHAAAIAPPAAATALPQNEAHAAFGIPVANVTVATAATTQPNQFGDVTVATSLTAGGLFFNQSSFVNVHGFVVESKVSQPSTIPVLPATAPNPAPLNNCVTNSGSTVLHNPAPRLVSSCPNVVVPSSGSDPTDLLAPFECRLAYFSTLTHDLNDPNDGSPTPEIVIAKYPWTSSLPISGGVPGGPWAHGSSGGPAASTLHDLIYPGSHNYYPWPEYWKPRNDPTDNSINETHVRANGWYLNNDGTPGALIKPLMGFGTTYCP